MPKYPKGHNYIAMKTEKPYIKILWTSRYSKTMNDDHMGRWARVAYAGRFDTGLGIVRGKPARWEIAWIKKLNDPKTKEFHGFVVHANFPYNAKVVFTTLPEAQKKVKTEFKRFIGACIHPANKKPVRGKKAVKNPDKKYYGKRGAKRFTRDMVAEINQRLGSLSQPQLAGVLQRVKEFNTTNCGWQEFELKGLLLASIENLQETAALKLKKNTP